MAERATRAIVLAAGKSSRFKTKKSKLLFTICGQPMVTYGLNLFQDLGIPVTMVLNHQADQIIDLVAKTGMTTVSHVIQQELLGTGHAVLSTQETWDSEDLVIIYGDMPLLTQEIITDLMRTHQETDAVLTFATAHVIDPKGYGRVFEQDGKFEIVEEKDCVGTQRQNTCINAGVYVMKTAFLREYIPKLSTSPVTGEIYLTELLKLASDDGLTIKAVSVPYDNVRGVNTLQELWSVEQIKRSDLMKYWMSQGVQFELAQSIHIDLDVTIGAGSFIGTGVHLLGKTVIGEECFIGAFSIIEDTVIGDNSNIHSHSVVQHSTIGTQVHVGPFARLRQNVVLGDHVNVGNFVEVKSSQIGAHTNTRHHSYLGDAVIGEHVNIGAGTITCNYDGVKHSQTVIEEGAFVGSNNTLIAPVTVGKGAYTAAGSVVNQDVPADALAISRSRQENKPGYAKKLRDEMLASTTGGNHIEKAKSMCNATDDEPMQFRGAVKTDNDQKAEF